MHVISGYVLVCLFVVALTPIPGRCHSISQRASGDQSILPDKKRASGDQSILPDKKSASGDQSILTDKNRASGDQSILPDKKRASGDQSILPDKKSASGDQSILTDKNRASGDQSIVPDKKTWCACEQTDIQRGSGPKIKPREILQQHKDAMLKESERINGTLKNFTHIFPNVARTRDPVKVLRKSCPSNDTRCSFWKMFKKNLNFQPSQNQQTLIERIKFYRQGFAFFAHIVDEMDKSNIFIETKRNKKVKEVVYELLRHPSRIDQIFCELETISTALNIPDSCETILFPPLILRIPKGRLVQYSPDLKRSDKLYIFSAHLDSMRKLNNKFLKALREMKS